MLFEVSGNRPGANNSLEVQVPCILFFVLTPIIVAIRIWSRIRTNIGLGYDDWTILVSFWAREDWVDSHTCLKAFSMTVSGFMMASCAYGFGQHIFNLHPYNKLMTLKVVSNNLFYIAQAFYKLTMNLTKASILLLYLRIFVQRYFRIMCYILLAIILSYMVAAFLAAVFQCTPIPRAWNKAIPGTCISLPENWYANAGFSIATDVLILLLPMPILYKSHMPVNQKAALMFCRGHQYYSYADAESIIDKSRYNFEMLTQHKVEIASSLWTIVEENVGIICACLPMCKYVLTFLFPSIFPQRSTPSPYPSYPRSTNRAFAHSSTGKNEWIPSRGGGREELSINLTTVKATGLNDNTSEEYMLPTAQESGKQERKTIHKAVDYEVTYTAMDSKENVVGFIRKPEQAASRHVS
ncbi:hypothetical protein D0Z07_4764 [Hyphodiscus hymeniophilus]|uniref:Rhodopsin domain-containing protein n=1 Tax=Hyphodiscus hymeniophilus TaxID=353542 RepID=A0A9P6VIU4_9HELO|nr:hypothetical protein D0Z07_4764 [Hyphodiscus hymeniophilus]